MFLGLRTVIYRADDLERATRWYSEALGIEPYFDQPFYVGFNVGGYELGLDPDADENAIEGTPSGLAYWGVENIETALEHLIGLGASKHTDVQEVGGDIRVAAVRDPFGNLLGIIENPHFSL